jgi:hypothetical protein
MVVILLIYIQDGRISKPQSWPYLFFVIIIPPVSWRFLRTPLEFIVGVSLLAACAVHSAGGAYNLLTMIYTWPWLIGAVLLIPAGIAEHRRFLDLSQQLNSASEV